MEKLMKTTIVIALLLVIIFSVLQVVALQGRQSQGYSQKYIFTYTTLGIVSAFVLVILFLISFIPSDGISQIFSLAEFDDEQEFRVNYKIMLIIAVLFFAVVTFTAATGLVQWQPQPTVFNLDEGVRSPLSSGHESALESLGVSKIEESWFSSFQPSVQEEPLFNFILPLIVTGLLLLIPLSLGGELDLTSYLFASIIACLITSGITGAYTTGLIPTFAGAHSDVYTSTPNFYAAASYSFIASFINVQLGFPITVFAHFSNNFFVSQGMAIALAIGTVKSGMIIAFLKKKRGSLWK